MIAGEVRKRLPNPQIPAAFTVSDSGEKNYRFSTK